MNIKNDSDELHIAIQEIKAQNEEKAKLAAERIIAEKELIFQNYEKEKRAQELFLTNLELSFQNGEKEKQANDLVHANIELLFQNAEKEKRAEELLIVNKELVFHISEKKKRSAELLSANQELAIHFREKEILAAELIQSNDELLRTEKHLKEHISGLESMMFMISHKVRQPIVNILGLSNLIDLAKNLPADLKQILEYIKQSALSLDAFTKELTALMSDLKETGPKSIIPGI